MLNRLPEQATLCSVLFPLREAYDMPMSVHIRTCPLDIPPSFGANHVSILPLSRCE